jgi:peroxiredoxin
VSIAAVVFLGSCSGKTPTHASTSAKSDNRKLAPDFTLTDANGNSVKLSDYRGKVVLLNFWATWCGPCALEIPWFVEFQQQYKSKGLEVIGISMDEDGWKVVKPYIQERKVNYRVLLGNDTVSQLYGGVESLPTTFIIDRDGKFAFSPHVGLAEKNEYLSEIQSLLGTKQQGSASLRAVHPLPALLVLGPAE